MWFWPQAQWGLKSTKFLKTQPLKKDVLDYVTSIQFTVFLKWNCKRARTRVLRQLTNVSSSNMQISFLIVTMWSMIFARRLGFTVKVWQDCLFQIRSRAPDIKQWTKTRKEKVSSGIIQAKPYSKRSRAILLTRFSTCGQFCTNSRRFNRYYLKRNFSDVFALNVSTFPVKKEAALDTECVICMDKARSCILAPCHHLCTCASCGNLLVSRKDACPICRRGISQIIPFYSS